MKPTIYLSGPMSGYENWNFPRFHEAAEQLRKLGFPVVNPADYGADPKLSWRDCLARDLHALAHCHVLVQLEGWDKSRGACLEYHVAIAFSMPTFGIHDVVKHDGAIVPTLDEIGCDPS